MLRSAFERAHYLRDREVAHRRDIAEHLAEKHDRGDTENMREAFIKIQDAIEAIERALWHERYIAGQQSEPFRFLASEIDSTAIANVFDSDADIAKKPALLRQRTAREL